MIKTDDFLRELVNTISSWVYNKSKTRAIIDQRLAETNEDYGNASNFLALSIRSDIYGIDCLNASFEIFQTTFGNAW